MVRLSIRIDETMVSLQGEVHGHLRVGCSTTSGKYVVPFLLADFLRRHPKVQATCMVSSRAQAVEDLCDGKVHIALASPQEFSRRDIEYRLFFTDPIYLIVPNNHPWALRKEIEPKELLEADFILREEGSGTRDVTECALQEVGLVLEDLNNILTLGNSEAIALAVQEGLGVGFVSRFVINHLVAGGVTPITVRGLSLHQDIYIAQNNKQQATKAQSTFWQFVTDPENPILRQLAGNGLQDMLLAQLYS